MKTFAAFFLVFCVIGVTMPRSAVGQDVASVAPPAVQVEKLITAFSVNYLGIAINQERRVGNSITLLYGLGGHYSYYSTNFPIGGTRFINVVDPYFGKDYSTAGITTYAWGEIRLYHTLFRRTERGKDTRYNSANYFALFGEIPLTKGDLINVPNLAIASPIGLKYGMRRSLGVHLYIDGSIGIANKISRSAHTLLPRMDLSVGWHL